MAVIDNFLDPYHFEQLSSIILGDEFTWFYRNEKVFKNDGDYRFIHGVYHIDYGGLTSNYFDIFEYSLYKLGIKKLHRIKANLNPKTKFHKCSKWHVDLPNNTSGKTAILYVNTNNGWTKFKKGGRVKSVENRIVIFDSNLEHAGVTCTDKNRRVVVNFNYV